MHLELSTRVTELVDVYRANPADARALFARDKNDLSNTQLVLYDKGKDFNIVWYKKTWGISVTNRMYSREVVTHKISYKGGKFYFIQGKRIQPFQLHMLDYFDKGKPIILEFLKSRFSWLRFVTEHKVFDGLTLNFFCTNKLYSYNDAVRAIYKVPLPVCKILIDYSKKHFKVEDFRKVWKEQQKVLKNVENLSVELISDSLFQDTCKMAGALGLKVNCSWSLKRLKLEHDKMSKTLTAIIYKYQKERELKIKDIYRHFADFSGYKLLTTNSELTLEGMRQNHCVGTYDTKVDNGNSAIYSIEDNTLQLCLSEFHFTYKKRPLYIAQFRGVGNNPAPRALYEAVEKKLTQFNYIVDIKELQEPSVVTALPSEMEWF